MARCPEIQAKAQKEIDEVVQGRLPQLSDERSLPFITALVNEVLRWKPVVPLGACESFGIGMAWNLRPAPAFPHKLTTDDTYNGYRLPAGSVVIPNAWSVHIVPFRGLLADAVGPRAMLHDPAVYGSDSSKFNPERFLNSDGNLNSLYPDAAFGFGRRSCPGKRMAVSFIFLVIARTLAAFDISKARDDQGRAIEPAAEYTQGMLR